MSDFSIMRVAALLAFALAPVQVSAQTDRAGPQPDGQSAVPPLCDVEIVSRSGNAVPAQDSTYPGGVMTALCEGRGYVLGEADGFVMLSHRDSGAVIVVMGAGHRQRVWLFLRGAGGRVISEDVTAELAYASGRSATATLTGLRIDLTDFHAAGVISIVPLGQGGSPATPTITVSLYERLMRYSEIAANNSENVQ